MLNVEQIELCCSGRPEEIKIAVKVGCLPLGERGENGSTILMYAAGYNPYPEVVYVLV